ncbi:nucleotide pyrophosphohydrolase [Embleya scabrispora]|uniref:Nucleotide pyrophosphohydrolase n=1 Tax=Embleya scabrispora TaxID=159449 RepID=A0A1T3P1L4_9ACTN|nr:nucleotide pyrophosphohydrolase [Embleya scabrispora]OPC82884.1 nucleotide pyrophosphohydrolase [Embleya scabrispora]
MDTTPPAGSDLAELTAAIAAFSAERHWQPFHTPKNLVMALSVEASELVEIFQWLTPEQADDVMSDPDRGEHVREEIADVLSYLLSLANRLGIDPAQALRDKMVKNAIKYPAGAPGL